MIRVRFAPSPTGYLHIGGLRTFLFNYLFTRHNKGKMILRIEDTDQKRFVPGAVEGLINTLTQMGLDCDEGPYLYKNILKEKGKHGPYVQSKRLDIYKNFVQKLIDDDMAYYCFCSEAELEQMRQEQTAKKLQPMYDERCRRLNEEEITIRLRSGQPYVIRLKIPEQGTVEIIDLIRGKVEFNYRDVDDPVLLKSDGLPTYHLANFIDDHLMQITHVLRAEEWVSSFPKHIFLYQSFGWSIPQFAHLPLVLNPDRSKLSKRQGDVAVEDYLAKGYLPEALINYIALLGWNPGTEQEIFSLKQLIKEFSIEKLQKAGAIFNIEKLDWLNGLYIRQLDIKKLTAFCLPYLINGDLIQQNNKQLTISETNEIVSIDWLAKIIKLEQERLKKFNEIGEKTRFFFTDNLDYDASILVWKKSDLAKTKENLQKIYDELKKISTQKFLISNIQDTLNQLGQNRGMGDIFWPFRVAMSGMQSSPPPAEIAEILGLEKTLKRIKVALEKLT